MRGRVAAPHPLWSPIALLIAWHLSPPGTCCALLRAAAVPAVLIAAFIVKSLPLAALRWLVVGVVLYVALSRLRSAAVEKRALIATVTRNAVPDGAPPFFDLSASSGQAEIDVETSEPHWMRRTSKRVAPVPP